MMTKIEKTILSGEQPTPFFITDECPSVIDFIWELIKEDECPVWGTALARRQTAGRGRMGQIWESPPGHIYGGLRLPLGPPFDGPGAALALSVLIAEAMLDLFALELKIKWPNDLIFNGGKAGGILLETRKNGLVAGVGLNLITPPDVDLKRDSQAPPAGALPFSARPEYIWQMLVKKIILLYNVSKKEMTMPALAKKAEKSLFWRGQEVTVKNPGAFPRIEENTLTGQLVGLTSSGLLQLTNSSGNFEIWSGSVYRGRSG